MRSLLVVVANGAAIYIVGDGELPGLDPYGARHSAICTSSSGGSFEISLTHTDRRRPSGSLHQVAGQEPPQSCRKDNSAASSGRTQVVPFRISHCLADRGNV